MNVLLAAVASHLLAGPADAASKTVYRPPIATVGEVSTADQEALQLRVDQEFARAEFVPVLPTGPSDCSTAACWRTAAEARQSHYLASVVVDALEADQRLQITIVDLTDGSTVVDLERACELCGRDELRDATADLTAAAVRALQSHAAVNTELNVDSVPSGASVFVDGQELGTTPLRVEVAPGAHTVQLSADGYESFSQQLDVERGTQESIRLRLSATPAPAPPPAIAAPAVAAPVDGPFRRRGRVVAGATLLGGGVATAVTGVTLMVLHGRPITSECVGSQVDVDGDCQFLHDTRTGGVIGLSVGAAAAIGGAVMLGVELRRDRPGTLALIPAPNGLRVRGQF